MGLPELLWQIVNVLPEGVMLRLGMTNPPYIVEHLKVERQAERAKGAMRQAEAGARDGAKSPIQDQNPKAHRPRRSPSPAVPSPL